MLPQPDKGAQPEHILEGVHRPRCRRDLRREQRACPAVAPVTKLADCGARKRGRHLRRVCHVRTLLRVCLSGIVLHKVRRATEDAPFGGNEALQLPGKTVMKVPTMTGLHSYSAPGCALMPLVARSMAVGFSRVRAVRWRPGAQPQRGSGGWCPRQGRPRGSSMPVMSGTRRDDPGARPVLQRTPGYAASGRLRRHKARHGRPPVPRRASRQISAPGKRGPGSSGGQ